jgi:cell division protein FtsQ
MKKYRRARRPPVRYQRPARPRNVVLRSKFRFERRQRMLKISQFLVSFCLIAFLLWWGWKSVTAFVFHTDYFKIKKIEIQGNKNISESEITALLPFRPGDNLFKILLSDTEQNIAQCKPELRNISIDRGWQKVVVNLKERMPVAFVTINGQRMGLDADNKPFPLRGHLFKMFLPEIVSDKEADRKRLLDFIKVFAPNAKALFPNITRLYAVHVNDVIFDLNDGVKVIWGLPEEEKIKPKLKKMQEVIVDARKRFSDIEYINLAYFDDGRIIVRPKDIQAVMSIPEQDRVIDLSKTKDKSRKI